MDADESLFRLDECATEEVAEEGQTKCFIPSCLVLLSRYPYLSTMKATASRVIPLLKSASSEFRRVVEDLAWDLTRVSTPPSAGLEVHFRLSRLKPPPEDSTASRYSTESLCLRLASPRDVQWSVDDFPTSLLFLKLSVKNVMTVMACILTERRLILLSRHLALLTPITLTLLELILPFRWAFTLVPVLPKSLLEFLSAPGVFIMGCDAEFREEIVEMLKDQDNDVVLVDLDSDSVHTVESSPPPSTSPSHRSSIVSHAESRSSLTPLSPLPATTCPPSRSALPSLPGEAAEGFERELSTVEFSFVELEFSVPTAFSPQSIYDRYRFFERSINEHVLSAALQLMVDLFRGVVDHINVRQRFFNRENFLKSRREEDRQFYSQVASTELFTNFVRERLDERNDPWTRLLWHKKHSLPSSSFYSSSSSPATTRKNLLRSFTSVNSLENRPILPRPETSSDMVAFELPSMDNKGGTSFYEDSIASINRTLKASPFSRHRADLLFLRGHFHVACHRPLEAVEDFDHVFHCDSTKFPFHHVTEVIEKLTPSQLAALKDADFFSKNSWKDADKGSKSAAVLYDVSMPTDDLDSIEFRKYCELLNISSDARIIERLFNALTLDGELRNVSCKTFELLFNCFQSNLDECSSVAAGLRQGHGQSQVVKGHLLKVSPTIRSSLGIGRLLLTTRRLLFLGNNQSLCQEICRVSDVENISKFHHTRRFSAGVASFRVTFACRESSGGEFHACLGDDRNWWYILLREVVCGKRFSDKLKDPYLLQEAATHVRLLDAVIASAEDETAPHSDFLDDVIAKLAHFTRSKEGPDEFVVSTEDDACSDPQVHRLNPTAGDGDLQTVEALLFVAGRPSSAASASASGQRLWAGLGNGRVVVFDATSWEKTAITIDGARRVTSLAWVHAPSAESGVSSGGAVKSVWTGSVDGAIHVIDSETLTCRQRAKGHEDVVVGLKVADGGRTVYSASLDGVLVEWNASSTVAMRVYSIKDAYGAARNHAGEDLGAVFAFDVETEWNFLWACTKYELIQLKINAVKESLLLKRILELKDKESGVRFPINCFLITDESVWVGSSDGRLGIFDKQKGNLSRHVSVNCGQNCKGFSQMILVGGKVWAPTKCGSIQIFAPKSGEWLANIRAHDAAIRSVCAAGERYVLTGSESKEGLIKVWRTQFEIQK